jgi:hypothetical protein
MPKSAPPQTVLDRARDELFSAIRQCGVLAAERDEQVEWMDETLGYMKERHPGLSRRSSTSSVTPACASASP